MSLQTTVPFRAQKRNLRRKTVNKCDSENNVGLEKKDVQNVKRDLFQYSNVDVGKKRCIDRIETISWNNDCGSPKKSKVVLCRQNTSLLRNAKHAFHTSLPSHMIGREKEIEKISSFLHKHIKSKKSGSIYISGAPGTGKTSCLMHILKSMENEINLIFINCMSMNNPALIYKSIAEKLQIKDCGSSKNLLKSIENYVVVSKTVCVLVLDEIDHLDSKGQEILYSLFALPQLPNSLVVLVGIANALDLTDRVLPRLQSFKYEPVLLHFQPYTKDEIVSILESRLSQTHDGHLVVKPNAIQLCARKIAACTGDIRKALDVCRRAIELTEKKTKEQLVLKASCDDRCNPGSPTKRLSPRKPVDLQEISAVLNEIYGSRIVASGTTKQKPVTLPLQQVIVLCSLILLKKSCMDKDLNLGRLYDVHKKICRKRQMAVVGESEFHVLCQLIESRGFIGLKKNKIARMTKICLKVEQGEIEQVLQDKTLLSSILADKSVV